MVRMVAAIATTAITTITHVIIVIASIIVTAITVVMLAAWPLTIIALGVAILDEGPISVFHLRVRLARAWTCLTLGLVLAHFVAHLATGTSPTELAVWLEAVVPVDANDATVQDGAVERVHSKCRFLARGILHEAEAARLHFHAIQAHDQVHHLSARGEELEQLRLKSEKGQVANVESC
eukprot:CAMPEP_0185580294 /NCGR_PEP_ID=MMETSP0434-20130131/16034_1 /TAXON_ID=626734 ORGANISM="Favella taraikaensis, Strain Fe Narragansett Bay" /NCGR_SAMPLE_ID=MMETSP0434 /ASSEMBLY_ACC=CAM_ASM_000379 /LENGTH=178 /DNA_ID=CAMNT_0028198515 /DNA_START=602 /DNA_END=1138 /DNA_ORIENTATION=+